MLETIKLPVRQGTEACFGGKHLDEFYVTTGSRPLDGGFGYEDVAQPPDSGYLLKITGLKVRGHKPNELEGYC